MAMSADFKVLGHRGVILPQGEIHQNSKQAFAQALATCDGFESDACASKDGDVFLLHEAKYVHAELGVEYCLDEHLTPESIAIAAGRKIEEMSSAEIRQLRLKDGTPIPELNATLAQVHAQAGAIFNIELKGYNVLAPVLKAIETGPLARERIVLSSFNHPSLVIARQQQPSMQLGAIFVAADTAPAPLFPWHADSAGSYCPYNEASLANPMLQDIRPDYIVMPDIELNEHAIELVARYFPTAQLIAWVFTERGGTDPDKMIKTTARLAPTGKLAGLIVDNPGLYTAPLRAAAGLA